MEPDMPSYEVLAYEVITPKDLRVVAHCRDIETANATADSLDRVLGYTCHFVRQVVEMAA